MNQASTSADKSPGDLRDPERPIHLSATDIQLQAGEPTPAASSWTARGGGRCEHQRWKNVGRFVAIGDGGSGQMHGSSNRGWSTLGKPFAGDRGVPSVEKVPSLIIVARDQPALW